MNCTHCNHVHETTGVAIPAGFKMRCQGCKQVITTVAVEGRKAKKVSEMDHAELVSVGLVELN